VTVFIAALFCLVLTPLGYSGIANERTWYLGGPRTKRESGAVRELRGVPAVALGVCYIIGAGASAGLGLTLLVL
jgi:hypothetical protein